MNYIVSYDISKNKNRRELSDFLIESGLTRIQLSVFHGNFSLKKREFLLERSKTFFHRATDSIAFIPFCKEDLEKYISVGKGAKLKIEKEGVVVII
ncbi:MAG: CRISPR-associated endonuclease Cas2 [Fusobacteriaceae bacterium]